ncbi:hypothetical protein [Streptomyces sp. NBC_01197]|uniref:hypothetical protein n=1 Tax=Streptomyces sp. NBC_01197 TaxID=2903768 RepID=UPI002E11C188|nr:hypothetical protein OG452_31775 [Streptomyces sp. NBC_01197]
MSYTDQDVREGRRLMNEGCENRLVIGDKLLAGTAAGGPDSAFDQYCDEIGLSPKTARQYRHTARRVHPAGAAARGRQWRPRQLQHAS